jgi:hypothetical protein
MARPCDSPAAQEYVLASAERVTSVGALASADWLQVATVKGMRFVVSKHDFEVGDMCVFVRPGALLPQHVSEFAFLRGRPVQAKVIRGELSEGLLGPMWWYSSKIIRDAMADPHHKLEFKVDIYKWSLECEKGVLEGSDMTRTLGVRPSQPPL